MLIECQTFSHALESGGPDLGGTQPEIFVTRAEQEGHGAEEFSACLSEAASSFSSLGSRCSLNSSQVCPSCHGRWCVKQVTNEHSFLNIGHMLCRSQCRCVP